MNTCIAVIVPPIPRYVVLRMANARSFAVAASTNALSTFLTSKDSIDSVDDYDVSTSAPQATKLSPVDSPSLPPPPLRTSRTLPLPSTTPAPPPLQSSWSDTYAETDVYSVHVPPSFLPIVMVRSDPVAGADTNFPDCQLLGPSDDRQTLGEDVTRPSSTKDPEYLLNQNAGGTDADSAHLNRNPNSTLVLFSAVESTVAPSNKHTKDRRGLKARVRRNQPKSDESSLYSRFAATDSLGSSTTGTGTADTESN